MGKELTGVVHGVLGRRRFLVRFQNGCEKNLSSNQLTVVTAHKILVEEAPEVSTIPEIPEDNVKKIEGVPSMCLCYTTVKNGGKN